MMNPSLEEVFLPSENKGRLGSSAKTAKKIPFSSTFPPNQEGNTFSEKYICQICSSPCPQGRQESTAVAADPQSPHPLAPSPPPLLPRLASTQSCLCLLPATTQKFWPQSLRALWLLSAVDLIAMQKGDFLEFMPQMFPVGTTRPVLTEKVKTCSNFYNFFSRPKSGEHHLLAAKNCKNSKQKFRGA